MQRTFGMRQFIIVFACTLAGLAIVREMEVVEYLSYAVEKGRLRALAERLPSESTMEDLNRPIRAVADLVTPAVVHIETRRRLSLRDFAAAAAESGRAEDFINAHPWLLEGGRAPVGADDLSVVSGLGSGFIVDAERGYIVTNYHVTEGADLIEVNLHDGRRFEATVVGTDPQSDLAILSIDADRLHQLKFGDSRRLAVGDDVFALGNPFGLSGTFTRGIVSGLQRSNIYLGGITYEGFIQTDAYINPGNSGGPLVNLRGEVIGVNTAIATSDGNYNGVGFAIPSARVVQLLPQLLAGGKIVRGFLGIVPASVHDNRERASELGWDESIGVIVHRIVESSPADKAGLEEGDIILEIADQRTDTATDLMDVIAGVMPSRRVPIRFWRSGSFHTVETEMIARPDGI